MKVKEIKIGIKNVKTALDDFVKAGEAVLKGENTPLEKGIFFTDFEVFRKALTPKRLELIHAIKMHKPSSINGLAKLLNRDIKNVAEDVKYLIQIGLIDSVRKTENKTALNISYDKIRLEIAV